MSWKNGTKRVVLVVSIIASVIGFFFGLDEIKNTDYSYVESLFFSKLHGHYSYVEMLKFSLLWAFVSFVIVWVSYYFIVWVVRWIIKGFRKEDKNEKEVE